MDRYKYRNTVERAIEKLSDKRGYVYLGTATATALLIWLRS
jgi:hypothetical protein